MSDEQTKIKILSVLVLFFADSELSLGFLLQINYYNKICINILT